MRIGEFVKGKSVCFSGRFDGPTLPHWITILRILDMGPKSIFVPILEYNGRRFPACKVEQAFIEARELSGIDENSLTFEVGNIHFAKISKENYLSLGCDCYLTGNDDVLAHFWEIDVPAMYIEATLGMHASEYGSRKQ